MFSRKSSKNNNKNGKATTDGPVSKPAGLFRRAVSTGSAPRLFAAPPARIVRNVSRQDEKVRKAPSAHMITTTMEQQQQSLQSAEFTVNSTTEASTVGTIGSCQTTATTASFFVNPPAFRIDNGEEKEDTSKNNNNGNTHHNSHQRSSSFQTFGVPMMGQCSDYYHAPSSSKSLLGKNKKPQSLNKRVVSTGSATAGARVFVNPPAFAQKKTLGVRML